MKKVKKLLSIVLSILILCSTIPAVNVFAANKPATPSITLTTGDSAFTVKWSKVSGASGYQIFYTTDSTFKKSVKTVQTTKTSYTVKKLKSYKKYYVKVRAYSVNKKKKTYSNKSNTKSIVTNVRPTSISGLKAGEATFTVTCKKTDKISGYQIQYSTDSKFKSAKKNSFFKQFNYCKKVR